MTLLSGSSSIEVDAPIERCWEVVADIERAPEWQRGLESVEVVQRDDAGRALICDTVTDARVTKVRCRVRVVYEAPRRLEFVRVSSDDVDELRGSWELAEVPGGRTTLVTYSMA
ncbi:MAG: type II toxin-antitoxin system RatA family toxin, partial [Solirubrobacteraceae bacterium]